MVARKKEKAPAPQISSPSSPAQTEMLNMLQRFDLDEEDLGLLRAEGIKRMDDFRRIKKLDELHLPSVTKQKVGELIASLPNDGQDSAMSKIRKSLGGLLDSLSGYLPSTPAKGAADTAASTPVSKALKPKGGITKTRKAPSKPDKVPVTAADATTRASRSRATPDTGTRAGDTILSSAAAWVQALGGILSPPAALSPRSPGTAEHAAPDCDAGDSRCGGELVGRPGGKQQTRQKQRNMIEVLGLPSQQARQLGSRQGLTLEAPGHPNPQGKARGGKAKALSAKLAAGGCGRKAAGQSGLKVKGEVALQMALRAKRTKRGFYNIRNLESLVWCKGRGTKKDPFVIE